MIDLPVLDNTQQLLFHVEAAISTESRRIQQSVGSIQGSIASSSTLVSDMQQPLVVELLSPPACCSEAEQRHTAEASVSGRVMIEGVLYGTAMVNKKDTLAAAVQFLKVSVMIRLLFCFVLHCTVLCYAVLCCAMLCRSVLRCLVSHCAVLCRVCLFVQLCADACKVCVCLCLSLCVSQEA